MDPVIFISSPPVLKELCALTICVKSHTHNKTAQAQLHVLRCREFIFSESNIIASPSYDLESCFNVIMQQSLYKAGRLQGRMQKLGLEFSKPFQVQPSLFQSCLRYTVIAKMAPSWNKVGEWFIQGREFVAQRGYVNAIKMNLCVNRDETFASICGTVVYFSPLQIEDLNLSRQEMLDILNSTKMDDGKQVELQDSWCHVLPSMKRGRISSVSLLIPKDSPFTSYMDLKRYWKNTYGYRLPETDEDVFYCQVSFLPTGGGKRFTYPDVCLRNGPIRVINRVDPKPIMTSFLQDVHARVGHICGQPLRFKPKMYHAVVSLHDANEELPCANLSNKSKDKMKGKTPLRSSQQILQMNQKYSNNTPSLESKLGRSIEKKNYSPGNEWNMKGDRKMKSASKDIVSGRAGTGSGSDSQHTTHFNSEPSSKENQSGKSPERNFIPKQSATHSTVENSLNSKTQESRQNCSPRDRQQTSSSSSQDGNHKKIKEMGCAKPLQEISNHDVKPAKLISDLRNVEIKTALAPTTSSRFIPIFRAKQKHSNSIYIPREENKSNSSKLVPVFKPKQAQSLTAVHQKPFNSNLKNTAFSSRSSQNITSSKNLIMSSKVPVMSPQTAVLNSTKSAMSFSKPSALLGSSSPLRKTPTTPASTPKSKSLFRVDDEGSTKSHVNFSLPASPPAKVFPIFRSQCVKDAGFVGSNPTMNRSTSPSHGKKVGGSAVAVAANNISAPNTPVQGKRKKNESDTGTPKKPRAKPQVQSLDIEALARANQLEKANTLTLMTWLKDRNIPCKSKDKKNVLIEKISVHLNLTLPEQ